MRLSLRVALAFVAGAFATAAGVVAAGGGMASYVVLMLVLLLAVRETLAARAPKDLRARLGLFVFLGVLAFVVVAAQRVRDALRL